MAKKINPDKYFKDLFERTEDYADKVRKIYAGTIDELTQIALKYKSDSSEETFSFSDNRKMSDEATKTLRTMYSQVYAEIQTGIKTEWSLANLQNDKLVQQIFGKNAIDNNHLAKYFTRNEEAMNAFFARKDQYGGLNLSQNVWKYTGQLKTEMEAALNLGIGEGGSASSISRKVRQYLQEPNKLFKRVQETVKDADGNITKTGKYKLSKAAKAYHPGQGVYRSSYKNTMRLTRTETNMAYHTADHERWQQMDLVVGYEVKLSNNHTLNGRPFHDICDDLKGKYPKTFKFVGWHPQCRCYVVAILCTSEEMQTLRQNVLDGKDSSGFVSKNQVSDLPDGYKNWIDANKERAKNAATTPYFIQDNYKYGNLEKGLRVPLVDPKVELQKKQYEAAKITANKKIQEAAKYDISGTEIDNLLAAINEGTTVDIKAMSKVVNKKIKEAKEALKDPFAQPTRAALEKEFDKASVDALLGAFNKHVSKKQGLNSQGYIAYLDTEIGWIQTHTLTKYKTSPRLMEMLTRERDAVKAQLAKNEAIEAKKIITETKALVKANSAKKSEVFSELKDKLKTLDSTSDLAKATEIQKDIQDELNRIEQLTQLKKLRKQAGDKFWSVEQFYTKEELALVRKLEDNLTLALSNGGSQADEISKALSDQRKKLAIKYKEKDIKILHLDKLSEAEYKKLLDEVRKNQDLTYYLDTAKGALYVGELEACAITKYTGGYYSSLNSYLRGESVYSITAAKKKEYDQFKIVCNRGLEKMPKFEGVVWRGANISESIIEGYAANMSKGLPITFEGFTSTSRIKGANFSGNVMFRIQSKTGAIVEDISLHKSEKEVLFRAGSRFKITKMEKRGYSGWIVELEELI